MSADKLQKTLDNLLNKLVKPKYEDVDHILVKVVDLSSELFPLIFVVGRNVREIRDWDDLTKSIIRILEYLKITNYNITSEIVFDK